MTITSCEKCGGYTPEGFSLCPPCMREAGADANEVKTAAEILDIVNIINVGDTEASQRTAIDSILKIKNRLERKTVETKETAQSQAQPPQKNASACPTPRAQSSTTKR